MDGLNMKIYNWYLDNIYYPIYRFIVLTIWDKIRPGTIKHYYQRARYGYSYQDCWSIDYHLADIIPKMLRDMKKTIHGCPGDIAEKWTEKDKEDPDMIHAMNEWEMILDKIANAFELEYEIIDHKLFDYKTKKQENKMGRAQPQMEARTQMDARRSLRRAPGYSSLS